MNEEQLTKMAAQEQVEIDELNAKLNGWLMVAMGRKDIYAKAVKSPTQKIINLFNDMLRQSHKDRCYIDALIQAREARTEDE